MEQLLKFILRKFFWGFGRHILSDKWYSKIRYWLELGNWPNLENPKKFTEKIQWIKLNERIKLRQLAANRLRVRNFIEKKVGGDHLVPLIDSFDEFTMQSWENLPNKFVLKANHGCKMVEIIPDKKEKNFNQIRAIINHWQQINYYNFSREWAYKGLPRTILAEKLLLNEVGEIPNDYKFFCFNGEVKIIQVDYDRFGDQKRNLFDRDFNRIDGNLLYPPYEGVTKKPAQIDQAIEVAEQLSSDFTFLRVDLYLMKEEIYFGELTNYPGNGFVSFQPDELEYKIGSWLELNIE